jgi:ADP-heptose:LPS heptosyltransferase
MTGISSKAVDSVAADNQPAAADMVDDARRAQALAAARNILVIKLGALGDMIIALGPFRAIRDRHPEAKLTLLTTAPYAEIGRRCGLFDEVLIDHRPHWHELGKWLSLRSLLRKGHYDMVYDLQNNDRTSIYFRLFWPQPAPLWCGSAPGSAFPFEDPRPPSRHAFERHEQQLALTGIDSIPLPDVTWMDTDISAYGIPEKAALIVPGSAPHRPEKRWPQQHFIALCDRLIKAGITPVILGTASEGIVTNQIAAACPEAVNLTGRTSLFDLASLGRAATVAIGNDTGPMHLIGAAGAPSVVLFSGASSPHLSAPIGPSVRTLQEASLDRLPVEKVWGVICEMLPDIDSQQGSRIAP